MANAVRRERSGAGNPHVYLMLCAALVLAAHASFGGTQSSLTATDGNRVAYGDNRYWTGGVAPVNDSAKAYDFVVNGGKNLFSPGVNSHLYVGGASLQLGDATTEGNFIIREVNHIIVFSDLRLYGGYMSQYNSGGWLRLDGPTTVYSAGTAPYRIIFQGSNDAYFNLKLSGGDESAVQLSHGGSLYLLSDQSATYSGSWVFGENTVVRPKYDASYGSIQTSTQAFGKAPSAFNPKGVVMKAGSMLRTEFSNRTYLASDNRGLWLDAAGSSVSFFMNNANYAFGWPIAGEGTFALTGSGTFLLSAACDVPIDVGANALLRLETGAELNGGLAATSAGSFCICQAVTAEGVASMPIRLGCELAGLGKPIAVMLSQIPSVAVVTDIPVAVIDKSVAASYAESDFDPWGVAGGQIANADRIVFSTDANGDTVVSVRVFPYVVSVTQNAGIVNLNDANGWSPNGVVTDGKNYIVWNNQLRTGTDGKDPCSMPGDLLVFYKAGNYGCKDYTTSFRKARLLDDAAFGLGLAHPSYRARFSGHIDVRTTKGGTASISSNGQKIRMEQNATLTGRGNLVMKGTARDPSVTTSDYAVEMTGDASGYVGTLFAQNFSSSPSAPMILKAAGETNFGGNPERFAADALKIGAMVALTPTAAMTIDDANRGVTFEATASVDTTSGDCTIKTPVVFEGAFEKDGAGTFAFGAGGVTFGTGASIAVNGGALKPEGVNALKGAAVSFADGAVLAFDADSDPLDLTTTTLSKAGDKYLVRIDGLVQDTPIATFASAQAAADFVANAKTVKGTCHKGQLKADGATVKAIVPGLAIIFR